MQQKVTYFSAGWFSLFALGWILLSLGLLPGCHPAEAGDDPNLRPRFCGGDPCVVPLRGTATLAARTTFDDYQGATLSIEHGVVLDDGRVKNDWDLLFGNDQDAGADYFTVNMVTDDRSFLVDLGNIPLDEVDETIDPADYAAGLRGEHDELQVHVGHVYVLRTVDSDTVQYAAVKVLSHTLNASVTLRWYRSPEPNRLVLPLADLTL